MRQKRTITLTPGEVIQACREHIATRLSMTLAGVPLLPEDQQVDGLNRRADPGELSFEIPIVAPTHLPPNDGRCPSCGAEPPEGFNQIDLILDPGAPLRGVANLRIGAEIAPRKAGAYFHLSFVSGDGDGYQNDIIRIGHRQPAQIQSLAEVFKGLLALGIDGTRLEAKRRAIPHYTEFFYDNEDAPHDGKKLLWPRDILSPVNFAALDGVDVIVRFPDGKERKADLV